VRSQPRSIRILNLIGAGVICATVTGWCLLTGWWVIGGEL